MSRPVVYVAGAFRSKNNPHGYNHWEQEKNIRRAEEVALGVWAAGGAAVCPHLNTRFFQGALPDDVWLDGDLDILAKCDAVVLVHGWTFSEGAMTEVRFAQDRGIPVYPTVEAFTNRQPIRLAPRVYEQDVSGNQITGP